jgi:small-conductance mechanosensitive channel
MGTDELKKGAKSMKRRFMNKRILIFLILFILWEGVYILHRQGTIHIPSVLYTSSRFIFITILTFLIVSILARITSTRIYSALSDDTELEQRIFISKIWEISLYFIGIAFILYSAGVSLASLTLFVGIITAGFAFALQSPLLAIVSWMVLLTKKPFRIGDYIKVGDDIGKVVHIGTFYVTLDVEWQSKKKKLKIPNRIFLEKSIENFGDTGVRDHIKFKLLRIPKDIEKRIVLIEREVKKLIAQGEEVAITVDIEGANATLLVTYFVDINKRKDVKNKLIFLLYEQNKDCLSQ